MSARWFIKNWYNQHISTGITNLVKNEDAYRHAFIMGLHSRFSSVKQIAMFSGRQDSENCKEAGGDLCVE